MAQHLEPLATGCDLGSPPRPIVLSVVADVGLAFPLLSVLLLGRLVVEVQVSVGYCQLHILWEFMLYT